MPFLKARLTNVHQNFLSKNTRFGLFIKKARAGLLTARRAVSAFLLKKPGPGF